MYFLHKWRHREGKTVKNILLPDKRLICWNIKVKTYFCDMQTLSKQLISMQMQFKLCWQNNACSIAIKCGKISLRIAYSIVLVSWKNPFFVCFHFVNDFIDERCEQSLISRNRYKPWKEFRVCKFYGYVLYAVQHYQQLNFSFIVTIWFEQWNNYILPFI